MRKLLSLATLASVIALPAFAQSFDPDVEPAILFPPLPTWARQARMRKHRPYTTEDMSGIVTHTDL